MDVVHIRDLADHGRWPKYATTVLGHGVRSILAVPFQLDGDTKAR